MASEGHSVQAGCRVLDVSESGYYEWRGRAPSLRSVRHVWLTEQILQIHTTFRGVYGARPDPRRTDPGPADQSRSRLGGVSDESCWHQGPSWEQATQAGPSDPDRNRPGGPQVHPDRTEQAVGHRHHRTPHPRGARSTALSSWTSSPGGSWAGQSTVRKPRRWSPTRCRWPSATENPASAP